jgi:hypothetical protein
VIPGYEVLGELGRGGMGIVYKARQTKLGRLVALKMILSGAHADPEERQRFLTEAEAVARLQHPNIVQIHEVGEADGHPFFSPEFCPGGSLAARLNGTPRPPGRAAELVEALAAAAGLLGLGAVTAVTVAALLVGLVHGARLEAERNEAQTQRGRAEVARSESEEQQRRAEAARDEADRAKEEVERQKREVETQKGEVERQRDLVRRTSYAAHTNLAATVWREIEGVLSLRDTITLIVKALRRGSRWRRSTLSSGRSARPAGRRLPICPLPSSPCRPWESSRPPGRRGRCSAWSATASGSSGSAASSQPCSAAARSKSPGWGRSATRRARSRAPSPGCRSGSTTSTARAAA